MIFYNFWLILQWYLRPFVKWFLRRTTCLCELQRICYGNKAGAPRTCKVEKSLTMSRTPDVQEVVKYLDNIAVQRIFRLRNSRDVLDPAVGIIIRVKKIHPKIHAPFIVSLRTCLEQIWFYKQLIEEVEDIRKTQYDSSNPDHERKLLQLWSLLVPNENLEARVTKQWQYIGFQVNYL